jgi:hypothetical protein
MKMNKKLLALFLVISVLVLSMTLFACNKVETDPADDVNNTPNAYQIPADLNINVEIYNGIELLGTAVNASFANVEQHKLSMNTVNDYGTTTSVVYIAYKLTDIVTALDLTLPEINSVYAVASDNYIVEAKNIANAYITIGLEEDGAFVADADSPRYVSDSQSTESKSINKKLAKVIFNDPLATVNVNVELYDSLTLLGTITNKELKKTARENVTMTTVNSMGTETSITYLAYKLSNITPKLKNFTLPEITSVFSRATDDYLVEAENITNAYISIGFVENGKFVEDADGPRYISDSTSNSSKSINKKIAKVIFNDPLTTVEVNVELYDNATLLKTITNDVLKKVARENVTITTVNSMGNETSVIYLAYKLSNITPKLKVTIPEITKVTSYDSTGNYTTETDNMDNAYITIGKITDDGKFEADSSSPRYLSDSTSTASKSVNKKVAKIVLNEAVA